MASRFGIRRQCSSTLLATLRATLRATLLAILCALIGAFSVGCNGCEEGNVGELRGEAAVPSSIDFGFVYPGFFFLETASLDNIGFAPLVVESVRFTHPAFSLGLPAPEVVAPGERALLSIRAMPTGDNVLRGEMEIQTDIGALTVELVAFIVSPPVCDDANPCLEGTLVPSDAGGAECEFEPLDGGECDDGNHCTVETTCVLGVCLGETRICDDEISCTNDYCEAEIGCVFDPDNTQCADDDPCTDDVCTESGCTFATTNDFTPCGDTNCDVAALCIGGACQEVPAFDGLPCDDGLAGSVGANCEDGVCLEGDVPPDVHIEWSIAEHTDLFYNVTSISSLAAGRVAVSTARGRDEDAEIHVLSQNSDGDIVYQNRVPNLSGAARFHSIGPDRYVRLNYDWDLGASLDMMLETVREVSPGVFEVEGQTQIPLSFPGSGDGAVVTWDNGVANCLTVSTPLDSSAFKLARFDLSVPNAPQRLADLPDTEADPCRGGEDVGFLHASGDVMVVGRNAGSVLGDEVYFYRITATTVDRIGVIQGTPRHLAIGPNTFVFQRADDDAWMFGRWLGTQFRSGELSSPCLAEAEIRPIVVDHGATYWRTARDDGFPPLYCRVNLPSVDGFIPEQQSWFHSLGDALDDEALTETASGIVSLGKVLFVRPFFPIRLGEETHGQLMSLSDGGGSMTPVANQGQVWDVRNAPNGNVVLFANAQGLLMSEDALEGPRTKGFSTFPLFGAVTPQTIAQSRLTTADGNLGILPVRPPFAGRCNQGALCWPDRFNAEMGRTTIRLSSTDASLQIAAISFREYTSATRINQCVGIGRQEGDGDTDPLRVLNACDPGQSIGTTVTLDLNPSEPYRLDNTFPHGDTHVTVAVSHPVLGTSSTEKEMTLVDVRDPRAPLILARVFSRPYRVVSAAYAEGVWAVVWQAEREDAQTTLTVVDVGADYDISPSTDDHTRRDADIGTMSTRYPARVLLVHNGYVYVSGVVPPGEGASTEETPVLNVYKLVGDTLFQVAQSTEPHIVTAMVVLDDGRILAADDNGWRTFRLLEAL